jgi:hypothetical protein
MGLKMEKTVSFFFPSKLVSKARRRRLRALDIPANPDQNLFTE